MKKAIVCIAKDEDDYIEEWASYHLKLGFDDIFIYENNWRADKKLASAHVHLIPFDGNVMQLKAYNTFIKDYGNMYDWAAFIDVDEFLVNTTKVPFDELLEKRSSYAQIGVNWRLMGSSGLHEGDTSTKSVLQRFIRGDKSLNKHVKQLINLKHFKDKSLPYPVFINPHCTNHYSTNMLGCTFFGPWQEMTLLYVYHDIELWHYAVKTPEELHRKVLRGRADTMQTREAEEAEYFKDHDKNDMELTLSRDFMLS